MIWVSGRTEVIGVKEGRGVCIPYERTRLQDTEVFEVDKYLLAGRYFDDLYVGTRGLGSGSSFDRKTSVLQQSCGSRIL